MKPIPPLLALLFLVFGCAEEYVADRLDPPYIVKINPPLQEIDPELLETPWGTHDNNVIVLNREGFQTVTVTFSSRPQNLSVNLERGPTHPQAYIVQGTKVVITLYCTVYVQGRYSDVKINWDDNGSASFGLYCPFGD